MNTEGLRTLPATWILYFSYSNLMIPTPYSASHNYLFLKTTQEEDWRKEESEKDLIKSLLRKSFLNYL